MVEYIQRDIASTFGALADSHLPALKTVATALTKMGAA
jgi:hypothetical protein